MVEVNGEVTDEGVKKKALTENRTHGNFYGYYQYRLGKRSRDVNLEEKVIKEEAGQGKIQEMDPRLEVMQKEWFQGKKCLDVGCNEGLLTIQIGQKFMPAYLLGVDIDDRLITKARNNIRQHILHSAVKDDSVQNEKKDSDDQENKSNLIPLSLKLWSVPKVSGSTILLGKSATGLTFPFNVVFKQEDITGGKLTGGAYDTITCVTKWIHLYHGDAGLQKVFQTMFRLLLPGGKLILEPQPWKSYHKRKFITEETTKNYEEIKMRPKDFSDYLINQVGFQSCQFLKVVKTSTERFRRPIYVYTK